MAKVGPSSAKRAWGAMFSTNSLVVYPAQGVGIIERIDRREIGGSSCEFYIVRIRANNITLMVPVQNAAAVGLRSLCTNQEAQAVLEFLRADIEKQVTTGQNWNRRFREYTERLKNENLLVVAEVLRELLLIGRGKELSFGERRLLEQALGLVGGELAEVLGTTLDAIRAELFELYTPYAPVEDKKTG